MTLSHVVVAGASLAGLRAAEQLRESGFDGRITMLGEEPHRAYDRPPLSKQILTGEWEADRTSLPAASDDAGLGLEWRPSTTATGLDLDDREVVLAGGERLAYDGLVISTGATPRRLPSSEHLLGVTTLRTLDDALALRADLERTPRRVAVVGAGFIGCEVAASCRARGLEVTLIEALALPLERVVPAVLGGVVADLHRDHGVDVRLGVGVAGLDGRDRVERIRLTDGTALDVDVVVVGIGVRPATEWLEGSGLRLDDGVVCDATTLAAPGVVAAGDVARWHDPRAGGLVRVEHWENAIAMGEHAAGRLLAGDRGEPYEPLPWFWSDQYDRKLQLAGSCSPTDDVEVVAGSLEERKFVAFIGREGRIVGVLGMNMPAKVMRWRSLVEQRAPWSAALAGARE